MAGLRTPALAVFLWLYCHHVLAGTLFAVPGDDVFFNISIASVLPTNTFIALERIPDDKHKLMVFLDRTNPPEISGPYRSRINFTGNIGQAEMNFWLYNVSIKDAGEFRVVPFGVRKVFGSQILAVAGRPEKPTIVERTIPEVNKDHVLECKTQSNSRPETNGFKMSFIWKRNDTVLVNNSVQTVQGKKLIIQRIQRENRFDKYTCMAYDSARLPSSGSSYYQIDPKYGPSEEPTLEPSNMTYFVEEGFDLANITCWTDCHPRCNVSWDRGLRYGAKLYLGVIDKAKSGIYRCTAQNPATKVNLTTALEVILTTHNATTAPLVLQRSDIECQTTSLKIFVPKDLVSGNGIVTWRDSACVVHSNGTHFVDSVGLRDCGTTLTFEADSVVFENDLILHKNGTQMQNGNNIVTYGSDYEFAIPVKCVYPRNSNISTSYIPIVQQVKILERRNGHLDLTMRQYEAEDYSHPVPFNAYPRQVPLNNDIFIRVAMENNVTGLGLSADNCFATSTPSPIDPNWYQLISSGCPINNAKIHPSGINDVKFSFHAFNFRHNTSGIVYVHCQVSVCLETDPACVVGCVTRKKRSASAREGAITSNLISTGPFIMTTDEGGVAMSTVVAAVSIAVAVIATVVAIIGWTRKSKKGADF